MNQKEGSTGLFSSVSNGNSIIIITNKAFLPNFYLVANFPDS